MDGTEARCQGIRAPDAPTLNQKKARSEKSYADLVSSSSAKWHKNTAANTPPGRAVTHAEARSMASLS